MDRGSALAVAAARLAARDAGLAVEKEPERVGVVVGTGGAGIETTGAFYRVVCESGPAAANPMLFPSTVSNAPAGQVAIALGALGPNTTFAEKAIAGENALAYGARLVASGRADAVLAGGVDEVSSYLLHGYRRYGAISPSGTARPFDRLRDGLLLGEGATFLVLETAERAARRGARPYAAIAGFAESSTPAGLAEYPRSPGPFARNVARALERAGAAPRDLSWVSASANGTRGLDRLEAAALGIALGPAAGEVPVSSLKGAIGDAMGGGALRAAAASLALAHGFVPGTPGLVEPDPALAEAAGCRLDLPREPRPGPIRAVLVTGLGDGGAMLSIVLAGAPN
jgi:3-oxoacyl-[acyl-carrier-protein] synthase II